MTPEQRAEKAMAVACECGMKCEDCERPKRRACREKAIAQAIRQAVQAERKGCIRTIAGLPALWRDDFIPDAPTIIEAQGVIRKRGEHD